MILTIRALSRLIVVLCVTVFVGCAPRTGSRNAVPADPSAVNATPGAASTPISQIPEFNPPYTHSVEGMKVQMGAAFRAWRTNDKSGFAVQLDTFAMDNPRNWLSTAFGPQTGTALVPGYKASLAKFKSHISWVSGNWVNAPDAGLVVEEAAVPEPPTKLGVEAGLPGLLVPLRIENFKFTLTVKGRPMDSWVFSFVFEDGAYRIVGGTFPFWWEALIHRQIPNAVYVK
jgi:hypothetical protein